MPVNSRHASYDQFAPQWKRCRDAYDGADAIKGAREAYLPRLDIHRDREAAALYEGYLARATYYNATGRTVTGLSGAICQKEPIFKVPDDMKEHLKDVTASTTAESAVMFIQQACEEVVKVGRYGVLVDMADDDETPKDSRPYWGARNAEDILNWRVERIDGEDRLTRVILGEKVEEPDPADPFVQKCVEQCRVLEIRLEESGERCYYVSIWRKVKRERDGKQIEEWEQYGEDAVPMRRGKPLPFIPFLVIGPISPTPDVKKPPLIDVVDVNLAHYRNSADYEHGLHYTGIPVFWISGSLKEDDGGPIKLGSSNTLMLSENGKAGVVQADGENLGALERALDRKQKMMATLGARLLEEQPNTQETLGAVGMRHAGEHASLRTIAQSIEQAFTQVVRWHAWWIGPQEAPAEVEASVELNKDYLAARLTPTELQALMGSYQGGGMSFDTLYFNLTRGEMTRPNVTAEQEKAAIEREGADGQPDPEPPDPGDDPEPDPDAPPKPPPPPKPPAPKP